jgi:hypothetical protein
MRHCSVALEGQRGLTGRWKRQFSSTGSSNAISGSTDPKRASSSLLQEVEIHLVRQSYLEALVIAILIGGAARIYP